MSEISVTFKSVLIGLAEEAAGPAGPLLGLLMDVLFPEKTLNVWDEIKDEVEKLVGEKIEDATYQHAKDHLKGIHNDLARFTEVREKSHDNESIRTNFNICLQNLLLVQPILMDKKDAKILAPLLAQFANLHLALLREGVKLGDSWGFSSDDIELFYSGPQGLKNQITGYTKWVNQNAPYNPPLHWPKSLVTPFETSPTSWNGKNAAARFNALKVNDVAYFWPFFDVRKYPKGNDVKRPDREIYFGVASGNGYLYNAPQFGLTIDNSKKERISGIEIFAHDRIDGFRCRFGPTLVPGPIVGTPNRSGSTDTDGGTTTKPFGYHSSLLGHDIVSIDAWYGSDTGGNLCNTSLNTVVFHVNVAGWSTPQLQNYEWGHKVIYSQEEHVLSNIYAGGGLHADKGCGAGFVVFGFRYRASYD